MLNCIVLIVVIFYLLYSMHIYIENKCYLETDCNILLDKSRNYFDTSNVRIFNDNDIRKQLFPTFKAIYSSLSSSDVIMDIGSNIGDVTYIFHNYYPHNLIYLAEPLLLNYLYTKERFNYTNNIIAINTAVGFNRSKIQITHYNIGNMMKTRKLLTTNITFINLDTYYSKYVGNGSVFFLKIDVEGYEDEVLFSATKLLTEKKIKIIYLEYHRTLCRYKASNLILYLQRLRYNCYLVGKFNIITPYKCLNKIDKLKYSHILCFINNYYNEKEFIKLYNKNNSIQT